MVYEHGLNQGTIIQNGVLYNLRHGLSAEQLKAILDGNNPFPEILYKNQ